MACEYCYYNNDEIYFPRLYCKLGKTCIYSKKCLKEERYIPLDNQKECYVYNMEKIKKIPNGSNYIKFEKKGFLYIDYNNNTIKVKNSLGKIDQNYIYVKKTEDSYEISLTEFPKATKKKKQYTRKAKEYEVEK